MVTVKVLLVKNCYGYTFTRVSNNMEDLDLNQIHQTDMALFRFGAPARTLRGGCCERRLGATSPGSAKVGSNLVQ